MSRWIRITDPAKISFSAKIDWDCLLGYQENNSAVQHTPVQVWEKKMYDGAFTATIVLFDDNQNYFVIRSWVKPRLYSVMELFNGSFSLSQIKSIVTKKVHERHQHHMSRKFRRGKF